MRISRLRLKNFRNISDLSVVPGPTFNLLVGNNAQGKTNVIESIGLISTGSSFRATDFRDMIRWGSESAEVVAEADGEAGSDRLSVRMDESRKNFLRNGKRAIASKSSGVTTVLFAPEEIMLLKDPPSARRRYIDTLIGQICRPHRTLVGKYEKVLRQRNRLLGDPDTSCDVKEAALKPWDDQLVELGARVVEARAEWCERLNGFLPTHYEGIAPQDDTARFEYMPCCGREAVSDGLKGIEEELTLQIERRRPDELVRGFTIVGPQRDDFDARIGENGVKHFGSQGQHRSFVLALKMSEASLFREVSGEEPVLLLDDVASELDSNRNRYFFESLGNARGQVFITATSEDHIDLAGSGDVVVFDVEAGRAEPRR